MVDLFYTMVDHLAVVFLQINGVSTNVKKTEH